MRVFQQKRELQWKLSQSRKELLLMQRSANKQNRAVSQKENQINEMISQLEKLETGASISVSDHAILRYFERVLGYDIEEIEKKILTPEVEKLVETLGGNGKYPNNDFQVCMKNNVVTTVMKKEKNV